MTFMLHRLVSIAGLAVRCRALSPPPCLCDAEEQCLCLLDIGMLVQVRMSEYNQLKGQVTAAARKQTGSLAVRDLTGLVSEDDAVNTENLLTLFTVVSKHDKGEWLSTYETLSDFVVRIPCLHIMLCILSPSPQMHIALLLPLNPHTLQSLAGIALSQC